MNAALKRQFEAANAADAEVVRQKQARGREIGTVQMYDKGKGFGFILDSDKEKLFVHQSQIISPGFRRLEENQKISFLRGENRGKPWAEDVRNPDGTPISFEEEQQETGGVSKKKKQQLKEQWRNFFEIPQYALKGYGESLPTTVFNQDSFVVGETVQQLGKLFVMAHGCCATAPRGNECSQYMKEKMGRHLTKAYEDKPEAGAGGALSTAFDSIEAEWMERAKMKSLTDGAEVCSGLFVHALNAAGQPCVQLWMASTGSCIPLLCTAEGVPVRLLEPQTTKKAKQQLDEAGFKVNDDGSAEVVFSEVGSALSQVHKLPASRLIGGRPFKTKKSPVHAKPEVKKVREWRCVAGEELFLLIISSEVASVLSDVDAVNAALDAWGSNADGLDGWEAASKAVVRTALAQGPAKDNLACMAVQFWWQEKPLQRLIARRADRQRSAGAQVASKAKDDLDDMFG